VGHDPAIIIVTSLYHVFVEEQQSTIPITNGMQTC